MFLMLRGFFTVFYSCIYPFCIQTCKPAPVFILDKYGGGGGGVGYFIYNSCINIKCKNVFISLLGAITINKDYYYY